MRSRLAILRRRRKYLAEEAHDIQVYLEALEAKLDALDLEIEEETK